MVSGGVRLTPAIYGCPRHIRGKVSVGFGVVGLQRFLDATPGGIFLSGNALGIDAEEHFDALPSPFGDLGGRHTGVELGGDAGVAEVVGPPGER